MILVVGATGQLGTAAVCRAVEMGRPVRALVRPTSDFQHLRVPGVELRFGDLRDRSSLSQACEGVDEVIATATVVFPRGRYSFDRDEGSGYRNLLEACRESRVGQLLFTSIVEFPPRYRASVPTLRLKAEIEDAIVKSGVPYTIFRAGPFMDDYFALIGSSLPLRGAEAASLRRPFWMSKLYLSLVGNMIESRGIALTPGPPTSCHSFIALSDVAEFLVRGIGHPDALDACYDIGGPETLSWHDVAQIYSELLERPVRAVQPFAPWALRLAALAMRPLSEAASNQLGILWSLADNDIIVDSQKAAETFGVQLISARRFLLNKLQISSS